jgi:hypothetical protein
VLFIGTRFSNLYTAVDTPAEAFESCISARRGGAAGPHNGSKFDLEILQAADCVLRLVSVIPWCSHPLELCQKVRSGKTCQSADGIPPKVVVNWESDGLLGPLWSVINET